MNSYDINYISISIIKSSLFIILGINNSDKVIVIMVKQIPIVNAIKNLKKKERKRDIFNNSIVNTN